MDRLALAARGGHAGDLSERDIVLRAGDITDAARAAAAALWDGVMLVAKVDGFFELKRSRTRDPVFG